MAYYIYRITPPRTLQLVETKEKYQEARTLVRAHRAELEADADTSFRMIFAHSPEEAEKLLSTPRDERVIGED